MNTKDKLRFNFFWNALNLLILLVSINVFSQSSNDSISKCTVKSLPELFKKKDSLLNIKPIPKNNFFLVIPIIGSSPATGFIYGAVTQYTFKGKHEKDKYSSFNVGATYTTNKQLLVNVKNTLLLNHNKFYFSGDWRYYVFSQDNYGLGTDIISDNGNSDFVLGSLAEPMDYDYFKFHQTISYNIVSDFYIGGGVHIDGYTNINDKLLDIDNDVLTNHYIYNQKYGYSTNEYFINGVSLNFVFDSRDNQVNANHGWYGNLNFRVNPVLWKNQESSSTAFAEFKYYIPLSKNNQQHVLAFWTYGQFLMTGNLPYLNLPAIGWDKTSRGGRGYTQGLFRGQNLAYFESEYRFPITCNQLLSGALFANFTTASDKDRGLQLFDVVQPAFGIGLRVLIDKATRTNLILNQAWGRHSNAFYLNAGETF